MYRNKKASSKYLSLWDWRKCKNSFKESYKNSIEYSFNEQINKKNFKKQESYIW